MRRFLRNIILFTIFGLFFGEIITRSFFLTSDIPRRVIDFNGIQKYIPEQRGYWKGGHHQWQINQKGWPGPLPESYDNLIAIIGDSYIENFMNPDECHQASYLKKSLPDHNFMEAARSGVSFIEAMEISKQFDSLNPKKLLVYLYDKDLFESILQIQKHSDITQIDLEQKKIIYGEMNSSGLKNILYNWKFIYYLFNRFPINLSSDELTPKVHSKVKDAMREKYALSKELLVYIKRNYITDNLLLIFKPDSDERLVHLCQSMGFNVLHLKIQGDQSWSFNNDSHWTCYGHMMAAEQVADELSQNLK